MEGREGGGKEVEDEVERLLWGARAEDDDVVVLVRWCDDSWVM